MVFMMKKRRRGVGGRGMAVLEEIADALDRSRYDGQEDYSILKCKRCFGV